MRCECIFQFTIQWKCLSVSGNMYILIWPTCNKTNHTATHKKDKTQLIYVIVVPMNASSTFLMSGHITFFGKYHITESFDRFSDRNGWFTPEIENLTGSRMLWPATDKALTNSWCEDYLTRCKGKDSVIGVRFLILPKLEISTKVFNF